MTSTTRNGGFPTRVLRRFSEGKRTGIFMDANVPCNGCVACCRAGYEIALKENESGDGLAIDASNGKRVLKRTENGACVHLGAAGCEVYEKRPMACRIYDCRPMAICGLVISDSAKEPRPEMNAVIQSWKFDLGRPGEMEAALSARIIAQSLVKNQKSDIDSAATVGASLWAENLKAARKVLGSVSDDERRKLFKALERAVVQP